jgi:predicted 3-demethylubiquinone-9 3-methyltransferase (glyoxalase superfamily)
MSFAGHRGQRDMNDITPCLWFDDQAEEAARFYTSVFPNSRIVRIAHYGESTEKAGQVLTVDFELDGRRFQALNGGPEFTHSPAFSLSVPCADQAEIDHYWEALLDGGEESECGWLGDRYGVSWQIVPAGIGELVTGPHGDAVMQAIFGMRKIVIADLEAVAA